MSHKFTISIILCSTILLSCSRLNLQGASQQENQAQTPLSTKILEPSQTPLPSLTPTNTPVPPEIIDAAKQSYLAVLTIQINAQNMDDVARGIQSGEFVGYDRYFAMLAVMAGVEGVQRSLPEIMPPDPLLQPWGKAADIHEQTREIIRAWFNDEIGLGDVKQGIAPLIVEADEVFLKVEQIMLENFNFDPEALSHERERILDSLPSILKPRGPSRLE